jgi:hypothetical protein
MPLLGSTNSLYTLNIFEKANIVILTFYLRHNFIIWMCGTKYGSIFWSSNNFSHTTIILSDDGPMKTENVTVENKIQSG